MKPARADGIERSRRDGQRAARSLSRLALALFVLVSAGTRSIAQDAPLTRSFHAKSSASFRVGLLVRTEVEGQRTEKIGEMTYAIPFRRTVEGRVAWRSTQRTIAISADGSAQFEETLDDFSAVQVTSQGQDQGTAELVEGLRDTLAQWAKNQSLRYAESTNGAVLGLRGGAPPLQESAPPLMSSWLAHALRPAAVLPARPLRLGDRWQEPRSMQAAGWTNVSAMESGEWLETPRHPEDGVRLHIVQQISGRLPAAAGEGVAEIQFHGESLNTIALKDGGLVSATRSASREQLRVLEAVAGLPEPPRFHATLSVQVEIEGCDDAACASSKVSGMGSQTGAQTGAQLGARR